MIVPIRRNQPTPTEDRMPFREAVTESETMAENTNLRAQLAKFAQLCARCRMTDCTGLWDDIRVCDDCLQILTDKYDRQPVASRGTYTDGFQAGRASAFLQAAEWTAEALRGDGT